MAMLRELYWGKYPLAKAFWIYYVLGSISCLIVVVVLQALFISIGIGTPGFIFGAVLILGYCFIATVGVWRSANAYPYTRWWPNLAKVAVSLWTARALWSFVDGGAEAFMQRILE